MAKRLEPPLMELLSEDEFEELNDLLLSDDLPEACMVAVTLEGFLKAISIGSVTVTPRHWCRASLAVTPKIPGQKFPL